MFTAQEPQMALRQERRKHRVGSFSRHVVLGPQQRLELTCRLPDLSGYLEFAVSSTFCPAERGPSLDTRHLGLRLEACFLSGDNQTDLLVELGGG